MSTQTPGPRRWFEGTAIDGEALAAELRSRIRGEVRFDAGSRALYSTDASNYRQAPIGVVIPRDVTAIAGTAVALTGGALWWAWCRQRRT